MALTLDVTAYESLFFIHEMAGVGRPVAVQLKVTLEPMKALWFFGFSTTSGNRRWGAKRDNQKAKTNGICKNILFFTYTIADFRTLFCYFITTAFDGDSEKK